MKLKALLVFLIALCISGCQTRPPKLTVGDWKELNAKDKDAWEFRGANGFNKILEKHWESSKIANPSEALDKPLKVIRLALPAPPSDNKPIEITIKVILNENGNVTSVKTLSTTSETYATGLYYAFMQAEFEPPIYKSKPTAAAFVVPFRFDSPK